MAVRCVGHGSPGAPGAGVLRARAAAPVLPTAGAQVRACVALPEPRLLGVLGAACLRAVLTPGLGSGQGRAGPQGLTSIWGARVWV